MPAGIVAAGQAGEERLEAVEALLVQAPQFDDRLGRDRRRAGRAPGSSRSCRRAGRPPACRACRRPRPRPLPAGQTGVRRTAARRSRRTRPRCPRARGGPRACCRRPKSRGRRGGRTIRCTPPRYGPRSFPARRSGAAAGGRGPRRRRQRAHDLRGVDVRAIAASAAGAYSGLTSACVASAPTPLAACGHSAPTAKKRLATATPKRAGRVTGDDRPGHAPPPLSAPGRRRRAPAA